MVCKQFNAFVLCRHVFLVTTRIFMCISQSLPKYNKLFTVKMSKDQD